MMKILQCPKKGLNGIDNICGLKTICGYTETFLNFIFISFTWSDFECYSIPFFMKLKSLFHNLIDTIELHTTTSTVEMKLYFKGLV